MKFTTERAYLWKKILTNKHNFLYNVSQMRIVLIVLLMD